MTTTIPIAENPTIAKFGPGPIFRCTVKVDRNFVCQSCGNVLVESYLPECFLNVNLVCGYCGQVSTTNQLQAGEILPLNTIVMPVGANYGVGETLAYRPDVCITLKSEIIQQFAFCAPKEPQAWRPISIGRLSQLEKRFEELSGVPADKRKAKYQRFISSGTEPVTELPFTWAIEKIRSKLDTLPLNLDDPEVASAIARIYLFETLDERWKHHPRYLPIAKEYANDLAFFHTLGFFLLASTTYEDGHLIGFSTENKTDEAKPDLYFRVAADRQFFLECKSAQSVIWRTGWKFDRARIKKNLESTLKKSHQINETRPGTIAVIVNHSGDELFEFVQTTIANFLEKKGRDRSHLHSVRALRYGAILRRGTKNPDEIAVGVDVKEILNPYSVVE